MHELGARMAARGRGGIIVMSSLAAETGAAMFRSMARRDVIELMSGITSQLVPPH